MGQYQFPVGGSNVALNAATTTKLFTNNNPDRRGVRFTNNSLINIYLVCIKPGETTPTFTTMVTNSVRYKTLIPGEFFEDENTKGDWYAISASGTPNLFCEELL
jgi:hypothetical protein